MADIASEVRNWNTTCPFCGGKAWVDASPHEDVVWVECRQCGARSPSARWEKKKPGDMPVFGTMGEATTFVINAWERRVNNG